MGQNVFKLYFNILMELKMMKIKSIFTVISMLLFSGAMFLSTNTTFAADGNTKVTIQGGSLKAISKVNINHASEKELVKNLNGIGASKAKAIIEYREKNGNFKNIDELVKVKGIGQKILEKNKEKLTI